MIFSKALEAHETWKNLKETANKLIPNIVLVGTKNAKTPEAPYVKIRYDAARDYKKVYISFWGKDGHSSGVTIEIGLLEDLSDVINAFLHKDKDGLPEGIIAWEEEFK